MRLSRQRGVLFCVWPAVLLGGVAASQISCAPAENPQSPVQRWDSSGVSIVESLLPVWAPGEAWHVSAEPQLALGENSDDPNYQFTTVVGARMSGDSTIVIADRRLAEVRFYSREGQLEGMVGGRGSGPGEFQDIQTLGDAGGDTTWVFDRRLQRITLLTSPDDPVHVINLVPTQRTWLAGRLPDGRWLVVLRFSLSDLNSEFGPGVHKDRGFLQRHDARGLLMDTIAAVPTLDIVHIVEDGGLRRLGPPVIAYNLTVVMGGAGYFAGTQETFEIGEHGSGGDLQCLVRLPNADVFLSDEVLRQALERRVRNTAEPSRDQYRAYLADLPRRATVPAFQDFLVDAVGNLWVSTLDYSARWRAWGRGWYVFDPEGTWLGIVLMPEHFEPRDIGDDWVLGVHLDDLDVQHVRLYRLIK